MFAGALVREKKNPGRCSFEDRLGMFALEFEVTDLGTPCDPVRMKRRLSRFKWQWHQFVLLVEHVDQSAIGWRGRKEFLGREAWKEAEQDAGKARKNQQCRFVASLEKCLSQHDWILHDRVSPR